jgi:ribosomal protein S18 acetylase RimI-like enzyme
MRIASAPVSGLSFAPASDGDEARVIATLVSAFIEDPVERWLFADPLQYLTHFPAFVAAFCGAAFAHRTAWMLADFAAVALWTPPGAQLADDPIIAALSNGVPPEQHADTFAVLEQMDAAHPTFPHWYLPWLGVDPTRRGTGLGGELLEQCLAIVDADRLPAYLETPNPRTISFYQRHGFEVTDIATAGECPPVTSMLREAR